MNCEYCKSPAFLRSKLCESCGAQSPSPIEVINTAKSDIAEMLSSSVADRTIVRACSRERERIKELLK